MGTIETNTAKTYTIRLSSEKSDRVIVVTEDEWEELVHLVLLKTSSKIGINYLDLVGENPRG